MQGALSDREAHAANLALIFLGRLFAAIVLKFNLVPDQEG